ncbi:hypothetical protein KDL01_24185 [Actinospica durhamensis]|uniref:Uncharacterized protein n=1 Tax=Actinospica durhamensis TaxID=1508375 RepID=A0A941IQM4_9ACTN|nr:hypothetical protein [Actinospica durhamensis]MBR7836399.1 hypothetical protein [Actinospica durhamensis]
MTRWVRCFWDEESVWFYFELSDGGVVLRQVEFAEPDGVAMAAASLDEWVQAEAEDRLAGYEAVYGATALIPFGEWEGHDPQWLTAEEFEGVWARAREARYRRRA